MWRKSCTKCGGDLFWECYPGEGPELTCLQCGRYATQDEIAGLALRRARPERTKAATRAA